MTIFVTGGAGYIGRHLLEKLVESEFDVVVIDKDCSPIPSAIRSSCHLIEIDLSHGESVMKIIEAFQKGDKDSIVVHLAAKKSVTESIRTPDLYQFNNFNSTINLLEAMRVTELRHIIFASSAAVYGLAESPIDENAACNPTNPYAEVKLREEQELWKFSQESDANSVSIFRFFNVAGASSPLLQEFDGENLIPTAINLSRKGEAVSIYGLNYPTNDGSCIRDFIDVRDLVEAILLSICQVERDNFEVLNLGSGSGVSVLQVLAELSKFLKVSTVIANKRTGDPAQVFANIEKAKRTLGWTPRFQISDTISSLFQ